MLLRYYRYRYDRQQKIIPTVLLLEALKACGRLKELECGRRMHADATVSGLDSDIYVSSTLVDMYAKCGCTQDAQSVFDAMDAPGVVAWTALMLGYIGNGQPEESLGLFNSMAATGVPRPNSRTLVAAFKALTAISAKETGQWAEGRFLKVASLGRGMSVHAKAAQDGYVLDIYVANSVMDLYSKCGSMGSARRVFDTMPCTNIVSWNTLLLGYADNGQEELALNVFDILVMRMCYNHVTLLVALKACAAQAARETARQVGGKLVKAASLERGMYIHSLTADGRDTSVGNALVDMYAKCGSISDARRVFDRVPHWSLVSWNALLLGYVENREAAMTLELFERMPNETRFCPSRATFLAVFKAVSESVAARKPEKKKLALLLEMGTAIHSQATSGGFGSDVFVATSLIDMYSKCGAMGDARRVFDAMAAHCIVSWNALMQGYVDNGQAGAALDALCGMRDEGLAPDAATFIAVLKACGSVAALEAGKEMCSLICRLGLEAEEAMATVIIDLYSKCGTAVDAKHLFDSVQVSNTVSWTALMAGYSRQGDITHALGTFQIMVEEDVPPDSITFVSLLAACSHAGLVDKGRKYFADMSSCKYGVRPGIEHYHCMIDMLGRANRVSEALGMLQSMPHKPNAVTWMILLGACRKWKVVQVGRLAFEAAIELDPRDAAAYMLMASVYGSAGMWEEQSRVEHMRLSARAWLRPGRSWWTDRRGMVHSFVAGDVSHPQSEEIYGLLKQSSGEGVHSERLAIACALLNTERGTTVRIIKNLRVCDDCHKTISVISSRHNRCIVCRDSSRFHVFRDGKCLCGDFW